MILYRRVQKENDELFYTIWSLVMVRNQLPAQLVNPRYSSVSQREIYNSNENNGLCLSHRRTSLDNVYSIFIAAYSLQSVSRILGFLQHDGRWLRQAIAEPESEIRPFANALIRTDKTQQKGRVSFVCLWRGTQRGVKREPARPQIIAENALKTH